MLPPTNYLVVSQSPGHIPSFASFTEHFSYRFAVVNSAVLASLAKRLNKIVRVWTPLIVVVNSGVSVLVDFDGFILSVCFERTFRFSFLRKEVMTQIGYDLWPHWASSCYIVHNTTITQGVNYFFILNFTSLFNRQLNKHIIYSLQFNRSIAKLHTGLIIEWY